MNDNPMHARFKSPRCKAHSKRTGLLCKAPAVRGYAVCRMHGARGGAPAGIRNGNYRHGARTNEFTNKIELTHELLKKTRTLRKALADCKSILE